MNEQELNGKLAERVGLQVHLVDTPSRRPEMWSQSKDGFTNEGWLDFTQSLDACFRRLVPDECSVSFNHSKGKVTCLLTIPRGKGIYGSNTYVVQANLGEDALALCLAIEKLIDLEIA